MNGYLVDTHVWLSLISESPSLTEVHREHIAGWQFANQLYLSPISAWEAAQKQSKGRLGLDGDVEEWVEASMRSGRLQLIDLTVPILIAANRLPGEIRGDPADRILAATARENGLTLVTHDTRLLRYAKQGHLRVYMV